MPGREARQAVSLTIFRAASIRDGYGFDVSAKGTVPPAIVATLVVNGYGDATRNSVALGGDSDTLD